MAYVLKRKRETPQRLLVTVVPGDGSVLLADLMHKDSTTRKKLIYCNYCCVDGPSYYSISNGVGMRPGRLR